MAFFAALGCKALAPVVVPAVGGLAVGLLAAAGLSRPRKLSVKRGIPWTTATVRHTDTDDELCLYEITERDDTETQSEQNEESGGGHQGEGGQGGGHQGGGGQGEKESDQVSESEEETDDKNKKSGRIQKTKRQGRRSGQKQQSVSSINIKSSREPETNHDLPAMILMGLLNVRSLNNKILRILKLILKHRLHVFCTTETWLKDDTGDTVLRRASPEDYRFCYQARLTRGGGAAIQVSPVLQSVQILFNCETTTFEVAATVLQHPDWGEPVLVISLYRRGSTGAKFHKFLDEFQEVLCEIFNLCNNVIVTGDFNVWVDNLRRGRKFRCLLQAYELDQQVKVPTTHRGHTLDLVITRNVEISGLFVQNDGISDHYSV